MIQRVQTIWLLLAAICAFLTLKFSFYSGVTPINPHVELNGQYNILLMILTVLVGLLATFSIFSYKNRTQQMTLCVVGLLAQIGCIAYYFKLLNDFIDGTIAIWAVLSFLIPIFFLLAIGGINKDRKLVKSLDRLR